MIHRHTANYLFEPGLQNIGSNTLILIERMIQIPDIIRNEMNVLIAISIYEEVQNHQSMMYWKLPVYVIIEVKLK